MRQAAGAYDMGRLYDYSGDDFIFLLPEKALSSRFSPDMVINPEISTKDKRISLGSIDKEFAKALLRHVPSAAFSQGHNPLGYKRIFIERMGGNKAGPVERMYSSTFPRSLLFSSAKKHNSFPNSSLDGGTESRIITVKPLEYPDRGMSCLYGMCCYAVVNGDVAKKIFPKYKTLFGTRVVMALSGKELTSDLIKSEDFRFVLPCAALQYYLAYDPCNDSFDIASKCHLHNEDAKPLICKKYPFVPGDCMCAAYINKSSLDCLLLLPFNSVKESAIVGTFGDMETKEGGYFSHQRHTVNLKK